MAKILKKVQLSTEQSISQSADSTKGTQSNPYTQEEMSQLQAQETWQGGYVEAMGMVPAMTEGMGASSGSGLWPIDIEYLLSKLQNISSFEKKCFRHYLTGKGDKLQLTSSEWDLVKDAAEGKGKRDENNSFTVKGKKYYRRSVSFYDNPDLDWALGVATVTFDADLKPVGITDDYNFNALKEGIRKDEDEYVTQIMGMLQLGTDYKITYGIY